MSNSMLDLQFELARARITLVIERTACNYMNSPESVLTVLQIHEGKVSALKDEIEKLAVLSATGVQPYDPAKWREACEATIAGCPAPVFSSNYEINTKLSKQMALMDDVIQPQARQVAASCLRAAYGAEPFSAEVFTLNCAAAATEAMRGCGQSDILWSKLTTEKIDGLLSMVCEQDQLIAKEIARNHGWMNDVEWAEMHDLIDEEGLCTHGLDPCHCPAGCGDIEE